MLVPCYVLLVLEIIKAIFFFPLVRIGRLGPLGWGYRISHVPDFLFLKWKLQIWNFPFLINDHIIPNKTQRDLSIFFLKEKKEIFSVCKQETIIRIHYPLTLFFAWFLEQLASIYTCLRFFFILIILFFFNEIILGFEDNFGKRKFGL